MKKFFFNCLILIFCALLFLPLLSIAHTGIGLVEFNDLIVNLKNIYKNDLAVNSLFVCLLSIFLSTCLGLFSGYCLWACPRPLKTLLRFLFVLPLVIPHYFTALNWIHWCGRQGWLSPYLETLGLEQIIYSPLGCAWILSLHFFPFITFPFASFIKQFNIHSWQVARSQVSKIRQFIYLFIKPLAISLSGSWILVAALSVVNFNVPALLRVNVYPIEIFSQFSAFYNEKAALIYSIPLILFVFLIASFLYFKSQQHLSKNYITTINKPSKKDKSISLILSPFLISLTSLGPIITFINKVGSHKQFIKTLKSTSTETLISLKVALITGCIVLMCVMIFTIIQKKGSHHIKISSTCFLFFTLGIPGTIWGIGCIYFFNRPNFLGQLYESLFIVGFVQGIQAFPFVVLYITYQLNSWSSHLNHVARIQKVSWMDQLKSIILPLWGGLFAQGWILAVLLCFTELAGTLLVAPPGGTTLPVRFFTLVHYGQEFMAASVCLLFMLLTISICSLPVLIFKYSLRTS